MTKFAGGGDNVRRKLRKRDGPNCWLCHKPFTDPEDPETIDHVKTKREGGTDGLYNLRLAHKSCNESRGKDQDPHIDGRTGYPHSTRPFGKTVLVFGCPWPDCDWQYWCDQESHVHRAHKAYAKHYPTHLSEQESLFDATDATDTDGRAQAPAVPAPH